MEEILFSALGLEVLGKFQAGFRKLQRFKVTFRKNDGLYGEAGGRDMTLLI